MGLKNKLIEQKPRETSGTSSSNRFDYQQDWAICKLLELFKSGNDFLMLLDYHDDVVVLDSESNPQSMGFYQLKTKDSGNWTLNALVKRKEGKNGPLSSIIGKLYGCKMTFPDHTLSLNFVSNASCSLELKDKKQKCVDKRLIKFSELSSTSITEITNKIKIEHSLADEPDLVDIMFFHVSDLILNDRETYVKGKLSDFMEELNPQGKFKISLIYTTIFDEIKRKNNYELEITDFDELLKHKSISKSYFQSILKNFDVDNTCEEMWQITQGQLLNELPLPIVLKLKTAWRKHEIERMDGTNAVIKALREDIRKLVVPFQSSLNISKLNAEVVEPVYQSYIKSNTRTIYGEYDIKAVILMEYYGI